MRNNIAIQGRKGGGGGESRPPVEASDTLRSIQYARILDLLCEGEIVGLVNGEKSVYFNDTPLVGSNGKYNFNKVTSTLKPGTQNQDPINGFKGIEVEVPVNTEVGYGVPVVRTISNTGISNLRLTMMIPRLTSQNNTTGDINGTSVSFTVAINPNNTGWIPTRLTSQAIALTKTGATANSLSGTPITQGIIEFTWTGIYPAPGNEETVQTCTWVVEYATQAAPTVWTTFGSGTSSAAPTYSDSFSDGGGVTYTPPTQSKKFTTLVLPETHYYFRVRIVSESVASTMLITAATGYTTASYDVIDGKTSSTYYKSYNIPLTGSGPWDIRVTRNTVNSTSSFLHNQTWFHSYTEITDTLLNYPNSAIIGISLDAEQFDSIPTRAYNIKGLKIKVPVNYTVATRTYSGIWDGTFKTEWSDNPAWCYYDMLTESRYGLGDYIDEAQVDKWALYEIAQYCDALVPDGFGGTEPRFTCNLYLQSQEEAYRLLNAMASIFRGMAYWMAGTITAVQDAPADSVALFTLANVIEGKFNYEGSSIKARHTVALVSWGDPTNFNRPTIEYVEDIESIAKYGLVTTDIIAVGCTSRGQAHRIGKWLLYTEKMESEIVSFRTGLEGLVVQPGQIIQTTDPLRAGARMGGRIVSATTSSITLDSTVTLSSGTYYLIVQLPTGAIESRTVSTTAGTHSTLTVSSVYSAAPQTHSMWVLSKPGILEPEFWRILSITEVDKVQAEITALAHNPGKYDLVEQDITLEPPSTYGLDLNLVDTPGGFSISESLYPITPSTAAVNLLVSWDSTAQRFLFEWKRDYENWSSRELSVSSYTFKPATVGTYSFRITAYNSLGAASDILEVSDTYVGNSMLVPPSNVPNVNATYEGNTIWLDWGIVSDLRGITYEVRIGEFWGSASVFPVGTSTRFKTRGDGNYWIKAKTGNGVYSTTEKGIRIEGSILVNNVLAIIDEDATNWGGTHEYTFKHIDGLTLGGSGLWSSIVSLISEPTIYLLGGHNSSGVYTIPSAHIIDIGSPGSCQLSSSLIFSIYDGSTLFSTHVSIAALPSVLVPNGGTGTIGIEMNLAQADGIYSGWQTFIPGDYYARYFNFRLILGSTHPLVAPYVQNWDTTVDVPDRIDSQEVTTPAGTLAVVFVKPFNVAPKIQATIQNAIAGDDIVVTAITTSGMNLTVKNAGASVARTVHYLAQGY